MVNEWFNNEVVSVSAIFDKKNEPYKKNGTNLFRVVDAIFTSTNNEFVKLVDNTVNSFAVFRILSKYLMRKQKGKLLKQLSEKLFYLNDKQWCFFAWSIMPKFSNTPFVKLEKYEEQPSKYDFLLEKIKKRLEIGENDWKHCRDYFIYDIKNNEVDYLVFYGCSKQEWKLLGQDYEQQRKINVVEVKEGLDRWI